jgi:hypothetical protein
MGNQIRPLTSQWLYYLPERRHPLAFEYLFIWLGISLSDFYNHYTKKGTLSGDSVSGSLIPVYIAYVDLPNAGLGRVFVFCTRHPRVTHRGFSKISRGYPNYPMINALREHLRPYGFWVPTAALLQMHHPHRGTTLRQATTTQGHIYDSTIRKR